MSLEHLKLSKNIICPVTGIAFVNFVLVIILLVMSATVFATPSGVDLQLPVDGAYAGADARSLSIDITSENVIYLNGKVTTLNELRRALAVSHGRQRLIKVKADRRASLGRLADILDLFRGIPEATVNVSTSF